MTASLDHQIRELIDEAPAITVEEIHQRAALRSLANGVVSDVVPIASSARHRRRALIAALAAALCLTMVFVGFPRAGESPGNAWAQAAIELAESAPRILVGHPPWEVTSLAPSPNGQGEIVLRDGSRAIELWWMDVSTFDSSRSLQTARAVPARDATVLGQTVSIYGREDSATGATTYTAWFRIDDQGIRVTTLCAERAPLVQVTEGTYVVNLPDGTTQERPAIRTAGGECLVPRMSADDLAAAMATFRLVDIDAWLAAMPPSIVRPDGRARAVRAMLADIPLPPDLDAEKLEHGSSVMDRYQLHVKVTGAVACGWIQTWIDARADGDTVQAAKAVKAMASSTDWPVLVEFEDEGGWAFVLRRWAAVLANDGRYDGPRGPGTERLTTTKGIGLGCTNGAD